MTPIQFLAIYLAIGFVISLFAVDGWSGMDTTPITYLFWMTSWLVVVLLILVVMTTMASGSLSAYFKKVDEPLNVF